MLKGMTGEGGPAPRTGCFYCKGISYFRCTTACQTPQAKSRSLHEKKFPLAPYRVCISTIRHVVLYSTQPLHLPESNDACIVV